MKLRSSSPAYFGLFLMIIISFLAVLGLTQVKILYLHEYLLVRHLPYELLLVIVSIIYWYYFLRKNCPISLKYNYVKTPLIIHLFFMFAIAVIFYSYWTQNKINFDMLATILGFSFLVSITEEITFRVAGFQAFKKNGISLSNSIYFSSILFSLFHLVNFLGRSDWDMLPFQLLNAFLIGVILCYLLIITESLFVPILFHTLLDGLTYINKANPIKFQNFISGLLLVFTILFFLVAILRLSKLKNLKTS